MSLIARNRLIYTAEGGKLGVRYGKLSIDDDDMPVAPEDLATPLYVSGLEPHDIGAHMMFCFPAGRRRTAQIELGYLVTAYSAGGDGVITPGDLVNHNPMEWSSPHLEGLILSLDAGELNQLNLHNLHNYVSSGKQFRQIGPPLEIPDPV